MHEYHELKSPIKTQELYLENRLGGQNGTEFEPKG